MAAADGRRVGGVVFRWRVVDIYMELDGVSKVRLWSFLSSLVCVCMWVVIAQPGSLGKGEYSALLEYTAYVSILKCRAGNGRARESLNGSERTPL